jgi:serine/threonine protein kinase
MPSKKWPATFPPALTRANFGPKLAGHTKSIRIMTLPDDAAQSSTPTESGQETPKTQTQSEQPSKKASPDNYRVRTVLGQGPFSRVETWVDKDTGAVVVAKTMTTELDGEQFARGARSLLGLDHPSLLKTLGFVPQTASSHAALLTTHAEQGTVADVLKAKVKLTPVQKAVILVGVAQALVHLHEKNLVHGSVKPSNIALDAKGNPQLICHAGIFARKQSGPQPVDAATAWCSPEFLNSGEVTAASDVYALGLLAYELISGKPVFDPGLKHWPLLQSIMSGARPELPPLPDAVTSLISRAWDIDPTVRPTAAEFFETLSTNNFAIAEGVDALSVRKYVSKFVSGPQPGESDAAAEARANQQTRDEVAELKGRLVELTGVLKTEQVKTAAMAAQFEKTVALLCKKLDELEGKISSIARELHPEQAPPQRTLPRVTEAE